MENTTLNQQGESVDEISSITLRYISSVRFVIPTKSILELERKIYTWLKIGTTGACIWGRARIGKSYSVQYIAKSIQQKFGENFPVIIWNITDHPATERNFYASLLMAMGLACGQIVLSVAVLAILITAPLGAIGMDMTYKKLLKKQENIS